MFWCDMIVQQPLPSCYHMRHLRRVSSVVRWWWLLLPLLLGHDLLTQRPPSALPLGHQLFQLKLQFLHLMANLQSQRRFWLVRLEGSKRYASWSTCWMSCKFFKEFHTYSGLKFLFGFWCYISQLDFLCPAHRTGFVCKPKLESSGWLNPRLRGRTLKFHNMWWTSGRLGTKTP